MTPLQFEQQNREMWRALESGIARVEGVAPRQALAGEPAVAAVDAAQLCALYRRCCEQLALAQVRAYPIRVTQRLQDLAFRAHRLIYRRQEFGLTRLRRLVAVEIPQSVRLHAPYVFAAMLLMLVPGLIVGVATYWNPAFALHVLDARDLDHFRSMYGTPGAGLAHARGAEDDWGMFGFYVMHNVGLGFQCFAGGIFAGLGSAFFLLENGVVFGAVAGYLTEEGWSTNFYSFVITHSAFELTAIVLSGAAGLRLGHALVSPGRLSRLESVRRAAAASTTLIYAVIVFLLVAAAIEAFWSPAGWIAPVVKFSVGACAWVLVCAYLAWQGRAGATRTDAAGRTANDAG